MDYGPADDRCQVWRGEIDGWTFLFMSDAGFLAEKWLVEHHVDVSADVLIKGHHADDFSALPEFLAAVAPRVLCFTNLAWPGQERVASGWIQRVQAGHTPYFDQGESGAVEISITPEALRLRGYVDGKLVELAK
jgi:beta-lactamase superfamily II metal-dependent hydrolase